MAKFRVVIRTIKTEDFEFSVNAETNQEAKRSAMRAYKDAPTAALLPFNLNDELLIVSTKVVKAP